MTAYSALTEITEPGAAPPSRIATIMVNAVDVMQDPEGNEFCIAGD
ncbi:hypothetical protein [Arthrobacter sp. UYCu712]